MLAVTSSMPTPSARSDAARFTPRGVSMRDDRLRRAVAFGLDSGASRRRVRRADSTIRQFADSTRTRRRIAIGSFLAF
jgi:hypothetical protein